MFPAVRIDLGKIEDNARAIALALDRLNIKMVGVVKACLGSPEVAKAMVRGGASMIADSRLINLERLTGLNVPLMMLRQPMRHEVERVVEITDVCLVSELETVALLSQAATAQRKHYRVIVMVETGDLREGVLPDSLYTFIQSAVTLPSITVDGIGTNVACLQGVSPTPAMLNRLVESAQRLRSELGIELPAISGGNSSVWKLIEAGTIPPEVNQLRLGEAILLGQETVAFDPIPGTHQDALIIEAEVIEAKEKPVLPEDMRPLVAGVEAEAGVSPPLSGVAGTRKRAILALGSQDICRGELRPLDPNVQVLRRSSDHLVVDITETKMTYRVGDTLAFVPGYEAMLAAMTSPFVEKQFIER